MSFLRKLFGTGDKPTKPSADSPHPLPETASAVAAGRRAVAPIPTAGRVVATGAARLLRVRRRRSSKFYAVSLEEEDGETWRVRFNFGRIGFPRAWAARVEAVPWPKAATTYMALIDEKQGKGYELRPWPTYLRLPDGHDRRG